MMCIVLSEAQVQQYILQITSLHVIKEKKREVDLSTSYES